MRVTRWQSRKCLIHKWKNAVKTIYLNNENQSLEEGVNVIAASYNNTQEGKLSLVTIYNPASVRPFEPQVKGDNYKSVFLHKKGVKGAKSTKISKEFQPIIKCSRRLRIHWDLRLKENRAWSPHGHYTPILYTYYKRERGEKALNWMLCLMIASRRERENFDYGEEGRYSLSHPSR